MLSSTSKTNLVKKKLNTAVPAVFFARGDSKVAVLPTPPPQHMTSYPVVTTVEHAAQHAAESANVAVNPIIDIYTHAYIVDAYTTRLQHA